MELDEEAIRQRARELAAQGAVEDPAALLRRARAEMERELRARTRDVGEHPHRMKPPLEVEEAMDPVQARKHWLETKRDERGAE